MSNIKIKRNFIDLFDTERPILKVKFNIYSDEEPTDVQIENCLEKKADTKGLTNLKAICTDSRLTDFLDFYDKYNGFSLGKVVPSKKLVKKTLLRQLPVSDL